MDFNFKSSFQIISLFHMYIDMGEIIAGEQDRLSLIIECPPPPPPRAPQIAKYLLFQLKGYYRIASLFDM